MPDDFRTPDRDLPPLRADEPGDHARTRSQPVGVGFDPFRYATADALERAGLRDGAAPKPNCGGAHGCDGVLQRGDHSRGDLARRHPPPLIRAATLSAAFFAMCLRIGAEVVAAAAPTSSAWMGLRIGPEDSGATVPLVMSSAAALPLDDDVLEALAILVLGEERET